MGEEVEKTKKDTCFCDFDELTISTQTVIADSGIFMTIEEFFEKIPIDVDEDEKCIEHEEHPTRTNGKKRVSMPFDFRDNSIVKEMMSNPIYSHNRLDDPKDWIQWIPHVKCRAMYYKNDLKKHPLIKFKTRDRYFRNALNVVQSVGDKLINFKLSKNGKFQVTGCKYLWQAQLCVVAFLHKIRRWCPTLIPRQMDIFFQTVMTNVDFNVGYNIDRQKLDACVHSKTGFYSLLETSFGYTGVNIKIPLPDEWWKTFIIPRDRIVFSHDTTSIVSEISEDHIVFDKVLSEADKKRLSQKKKYNTFLVFHSGNIIMSGMSPQIMKHDYARFTSYLSEWRSDIKEHILKS